MAVAKKYVAHCRTRKNGIAIIVAGTIDRYRRISGGKEAIANHPVCNRSKRTRQYCIDETKRRTHRLVRPNHSVVANHFRQDCQNHDGTTCTDLAWCRSFSLMRYRTNRTTAGTTTLLVPQQPDYCNAVWFQRRLPKKICTSCWHTQIHHIVVCHHRRKTNQFGLPIP